MKSVSMGKIAVLALLTTVTVGSIVMIANSKSKTEDTGAGAPTTTYQVSAREERN